MNRGSPFGTGGQAAVRKTLETAVAAIRAGALDEAERILVRDATALATPVGQNILGDVWLKRGATRDALKAFDQALRLAPQMPEAACNRSAALHVLGRFEDAVTAAERALRYRPNYATAHFNRGNALSALGRHEDAAAAFGKAIAVQPRFPEAHLNRGYAYIALARWLEAVADFGKALAMNPGMATAHMGRAEAFRALGDHGQAMAAVDAALAAEPDNVGVLVLRVDVQLDAERLQEAMAAVDELVARYPDRADGHVRRSAVLSKLKRHDEALAAADEAVRLAPDAAAGHEVRGLALSQAGRAEEGLVALNRAEQLGAEGPTFLHARAVALATLDDPARSLPDFDRAIALRPHSADFRFNRALALLSLGRFTEGWADYEMRMERRKSANRALAAAPQWTGEPLEGKRLVIHSEQGHGDSIQFTRYLPLVAERGAKITLMVQQALRRLYEDNFPGLDVVDDLGARAGFDYQISLMSLPFVFGTTLETIPRNIPYLRADPVRVQRWATRIGDNGFRIGIAWQGNPKYGADRQRSIALDNFAPLAKVPGVRLISLQWTGRGGSPVAAAAGFAIETLGEEIENNPDGFREVAAAMESLDLLVTSDTGPAHLAGALGRPVWVALSKRPDWRWMRQGSETPWYPTMRLFRQEAPGDWAGVFARIAAEVTTLATRRET